MDASTIWWLVAGALIVAELTTGSFYLLMLALGAAAGAMAAHLGFGVSLQVVLAAAAGALTTGGWYLRNRRRNIDAPDVQSNRNVNLDIGEAVDVSTWDAQGRTTVSYRGANWSARFVGDGAPQPGPHRIAALRGNQLELTKL